ncbi:related to Allergen Asp f 4 [Rhynchosporium graminicola]|uniref:Related to Allergen Asp f 4 n=1 Tax=Rhynchosporium graminicola TaxID=2792576 RepID=A0A1E1KF08_9HELO|nr:related to Allergen Asp f 4 [Rhynchosporium commune]
MRCSTISAIVMAVVIGEAVAGPAHYHLHRRAHKNMKKNVDWESLDWANMGIDWKDAYAKGQTDKTPPAPASPAAPAAPAAAAFKEVPAAPVAAPAAAPAKSSPPASGAADVVSANSAVSDVVDDISSLLGGLVGASNSRKAFGLPSPVHGQLGDDYIGNCGIPYGSNVIKVDSTSGYDFTNTFVNTGKKAMVINLWQKMGSDKLPLSGSANAPKNTTLTFALKPGQSQVVAFQEDTQVAWAQVCNEFHDSGAYATVWGEAQFRKAGSGFDYSAIMSKNANNYDMTITSKENDCVSSQTENFWLAAYKPIGNSDGSCYVPGPTMHLTTKMGGVIS